MNRALRRGVAALGRAAWPSATSGVPHPEQVLRPVRPGFMWSTLVIALLFNLLPWGRSFWAPDFFALTLIFWNVHQPRRVGMGVAFGFGLLMDVHNGALFGQHALAYTLLSYGAISLHRRILWFGGRSQAIYVLVLLLVAQLASAGVRLWVGAASAGWWWDLSSCLVGAALWAPWRAFLLAPQRRPVQRDDTRPL